MHLAFALFADSANLSQEGKLNILGVFDAVQVAQFPSVHPRAHLVMRLKGTRTDAGTHSVGFAWVDPHGEELWNSTGQLEIGAPPAVVNEIDMPLIAPMDLPLNMPGVFTMTIRIDGERQGELRLHARDVSTPLPGGALVS